MHSELGQTPLARWSADATPLREVPAAGLRWMLMADAERTIGKDGIHFDGLRFIAPELNGRVGEKVQVRYTPHDLRQIEVFRGDEWLATAYPQDQLTAEQRAAVHERRRADAAELGKRQRRASRRARATLAPITAPGEVVDTTIISAEQARADEDRPERAAGHDEDLRRQAMTSLLDLKTDFAYWNPEVAMTPDPPAPRRPPHTSTRRRAARRRRARYHRGRGELMGRHFLDIEGARTMPTPGLVATHRAVGDLLRSSAMGVVHGPVVISGLIVKS